MFSTDYIQKTRRIMNRLHKNQRRNTITREEKEKRIAETTRTEQKHKRKRRTNAKRRDAKNKNL